MTSEGFFKSDIKKKKKNISFNDVLHISLKPKNNDKLLHSRSESAKNYNK